MTFTHIALLLIIKHSVLPIHARTHVAIPIILIPMIAADPFGPGVANTINSAQFLGAIVSLSTLGAGIGKLINGFVCRAIGGRASGSLYLLGLSIFSVILSSTYTIHGYGTYNGFNFYQLHDTYIGFVMSVLLIVIYLSIFYSSCWNGILCIHAMDSMQCNGFNTLCK